VGDLTLYSRVRRALLFAIPAALGTRLLPAQLPVQENNDSQDDLRLPNGKRQKDEILKADYEKNLKDAQEMMNLTRSFEEDLEKNDRFVLSVGALKKLDDIEKLTRRIRGRLKRI
jgi:hypothetical protein